MNKAPRAEPAHDGNKSRAGPAHERKKSRRSRSKILMIVSSVVVPVIGLIIGWLTYLNQHGANADAKTSAAQAYAADVSFYLRSIQSVSAQLNQRPGPAGELDRLLYSVISRAPIHVFSRGALATLLSFNVDYVAEMENRSNSAIYDVDLTIEVRTGAGHVLDSVTINVGIIPPCEMASVNSVSRAVSDLSSELLANPATRNIAFGQIQMYVTYMIFTDGGGVRWLRWENGSFAKYTGRISSSLSMEFPVSNDITPPPGSLFGT
jgi:hypothetical protein